MLLYSLYYFLKCKQYFFCRAFFWVGVVLNEELGEEEEEGEDGKITML